MISKTRSETLGMYFLNSFVVKCNVKINFENVSESDTYDKLGTFFHEYIHFLQSASTTYGNINMAYFYASTMNILYKVCKNPTDEVNRIVHDNPQTEVAGNICNITMGDAEQWTYEDYDSISIVDTVYKVDDTFDSEYEMATTPILNLKVCKKDEEDIKLFNFGAMAIMESMASLLERYLYNIRYQGKQVQYDICSILWDYFAPQFVGRNDLVVAACECSLMYENPGLTYFTILKVIISKRKGEIDVNDILIIFKKSIKPNFEEIYKKYYSEMIRLLCDLVPKHNSYSDTLNSYVCEFCHKLFDLRNKDNIFLTDLMLLEPNVAKHALLKLMDETKAIPLIINEDNDVYSAFEQENKMDMTNYLALYSFKRLFGINGKNECFMLDICKKNSGRYVNESCLNSLWEKVNEDALCPMARLWYMWSLQGKRIVD